MAIQYQVQKLKWKYAALSSVFALISTRVHASGPGECKELPNRPDPLVIAQAAQLEDTKLFARYVGEYHSDRQKFDDSEIEYDFSLKYEWLDENKTIMKFVVSMIVPEQSKTIVRSEGFYGFDPFDRRLFAFGAFKTGVTGKAVAHQFDHESGVRTILAKIKGPDGTVTLISDQFEVVSDGVLKKNVYMCNAETGEWTHTYEGIYTRV